MRVKSRKPEAAKVTKGAEHVKTFQKTPLSQRQYCGKCGGHLMTNHPGLGLVDVFAATIPTLAFAPGVHINYAETVLPMLEGDTAGPGNLDLKTAGVGRPMLVNVFASWCAPCRIEHPKLLALKARGIAAGETLRGLDKAPGPR